MSRPTTNQHQVASMVSAPPAAAVVALLFSFEGAHPPVGTPTAESHRGNSAPARAPVAGRWKSERTGEHSARSLAFALRSPAAVALAGGVHRG